MSDGQAAIARQWADPAAVGLELVDQVAVVQEVVAEAGAVEGGADRKIARESRRSDGRAQQSMPRGLPEACCANKTLKRDGDLTYRASTEGPPKLQFTPTQTILPFRSILCVGAVAGKLMARGVLLWMASRFG